MIRVSGLHEQLEAAALVEASPDGLLGRASSSTRIGQIVRGQLETAATLLADDLLPGAGRRAGIRIRDWSALDAETKQLARKYFRRSVFPVVTPLAVDPGHPFPFLSNLSLSLAVEARDPETKERKFARIKVPEILPRFVPFEAFDAGRAAAAPPTAPHDFLPLEQLLAANLDELFPGMEILGDLSVPRHPRHGLSTSSRTRRTICCRSSTARSGGAASAPACGWRSTPGIPDRVRAAADREAGDRRGGRLRRRPGRSGLRRAHVDRRPRRGPSCATRRSSPRLPARARREGRHLRAHPQGRRPAAPPLRLVRAGAVLPAPGGRGSRRAGDQDDALPHRLERRGGAARSSARPRTASRSPSRSRSRRASTRRTTSPGRARWSARARTSSSATPS